MTTHHTRRWSPIEDLPANWESLRDPQLTSLVSVWSDQRAELEKGNAYQEFLERLRRQWAIETGIIERLYTLSEGATKTLIEQGLDAALIGDEDTDRSPREVVDMITDQYAALKGITSFLAGERPLGVSYLKELHRVLTAHQESCDARDSFGKLTRVPLEKGAWKKWPNNIEFEDGSRFEFCPPEQCQSEVEQLLRLHVDHERQGVPPEIEAAWIHHRFTLIHPFQDGNGRVARCLATLVLLKANWFPLVVTRSDRASYIQALRGADDGNLSPLIALFSELQRRAILNALEISGDVAEAAEKTEDLVASVMPILVGRKQKKESRVELAKKVSDALVFAAYERLSVVSGELHSKLASVESSYKAYAAEGRRDSEEAQYHYFQTVQAAKQLGYFANLELYRAWAGLVIQTETRVEILLSFHGRGPSTRGVLVCTPMIYRKTKTRTDETSTEQTQVTDIEPLSSEPFTFTYRDDAKQVVRAFLVWLEPVLLKGLSRWKEWL